MIPPRPLSLLAVSFLLAPAAVQAQGALTPPGSPAATMRTLDQVQPRTPLATAGVTISAPGSYYLTGNLNGNGTSAGLTIAGSNITVDLNGFALTRTLNAGLEPGIIIQASASNVVIRNGSIVNWGSDGIRSVPGAAGNRFEDLAIINNGGTGLLAGAEAQLRRCVAQYQTSDGIVAGFRSRVEDCQSSDNGGVGISVGTDSVLLRSSGLRSGQAGISLGERGTAIGCTASLNGTSGFFGAGSNFIRECVASFNTGAGMLVSVQTRLEHCRTEGNGNFGIFAGSRSSLRHCSSDGVVGANGYGLAAGLNSVFANCTSTGAALGGYQIASGSLVTDCQASGNLDGFVVASGCRLSGCQSSSNNGSGFLLQGSNNQLTGSHAGSNAQSGVIVSGSGNRVESCQLFFNGSFGLQIVNPGVNNQVFRNTINGNSVSNLNVTGPQIIGPSIASGLDPNLGQPNANVVY